MPLCTRCTALIAGVVVGYLSELSLSLPAGVLLASPAVLDGALHHLGEVQSTNLRRVLTGIPGGMGLWVLAIEANATLGVL